MKGWSMLAEDFPPHLTWEVWPHRGVTGTQQVFVFTKSPHFPLSAGSSSPSLLPKEEEVEPICKETMG